MLKKDDTKGSYEWEQSTDEKPAIYYVAHEDQWKCTSYTLVRDLLSRTNVFGNTYPGPGRQRLASGLMLQDPPRHTELRGVVNQAFTPKALAYLAPRIRTLVHELLEKAIQRGRMDVITDLAFPLTEHIILEHLGLPFKDRHFLYTNCGRIALSPPPEFRHYLLDVLRSHQQHPHNDTISMLLEATIDGHKLGTKEIIEIVHQSVVAGRDTVAYNIGNSIYYFSQHPDIWEQLRVNPAFVPDALEEIIRLHPPFSEVRRRALCDTELAGQHIQAGQTIIGLLNPVNHDEAQFACPYSFDMQRVPNRHLSFGHGRHFCVGAALTRLETQIALEVLLERLPALKVQQAGAPILVGRLLGTRNLVLAL